MSETDHDRDVKRTYARDSVVLTLDRPDRHNAIGGELLALLLEYAEHADGDGATRSIITTGAGRVYCAGGDLQSLRRGGEGSVIDLGELGTEALGGRTGIDRSSGGQIRDDHLGVGRWALRFSSIGVPTIAAINGAAAGGGFAVAMLHDIRIMASTAKFAPNFQRIGVAPEFGLTWVLPRIVGATRAYEILTRTTSIGAEEALELGLVQQVVEPQELMEAAHTRAEALHGGADQTLRAVKRLLLASSSSSFADQLEREWAAQNKLFLAPSTQRLLDQLAGQIGGKETKTGA
ncbi:enoyl-CoA hydratase-related protein [Nocardia sp. R6R-6]|uniref:enoyl-CoA hydratase-related protein n=1 Tax=Nocardia sp. R6R-6 TaxID=3459303 RepID=UPI00403DBE08